MVAFLPQNALFSPPHGGNSSAVKSLSHQLDLSLHDEVAVVAVAMDMVLRSGDEEKSNGVDFSSTTSLNDLHRKMSLTLTLTSTSPSSFLLGVNFLEKLRGNTDGDFKEANWRSLTMADILAFFDQLLRSTMFDFGGTTVDLHGFFLGYIGKPFDGGGVRETELSSLRKSLSIIGRCNGVAMINFDRFLIIF